MGIQVIEGTWEEVLKRESELAGRRVKLIVVDEIPETDLRERAQALVEQAATIKPSRVLKDSTGQASAYADAVADKYRRQGFHL